MMALAFKTTQTKANSIFTFIHTDKAKPKATVLYIQQTQSNISVHLESYLCPSGECYSKIHSHVHSVFGLYPLLRKISGSSAAKSSTYAHQPVANCVCLLFGADQVACSGFIRDFYLLLHAAVI